MHLGSSPLVALCFTLGALWPPGESEGDDGEAECLRSAPPEQFEFDWAHTWLKEGGAPVLDEDKLKGYFPRYSWFSQAFPPFLSSDLFPYTGLCLCFKIN